jgi:hypothetical protein
VVETAAGIGIARKSRGLNEAGNAAGKVRISKCRVGYPIEFPGKPVKIMDRYRFQYGIDSRPCRIPVGGDAEHGCNIRKAGTEPCKEFAGRHILFHRQGRGTMRDKKGGKSFRGHE